MQTQKSDHEGLVMRSVKRTLQDQKELYLTPFKPSNFKWDALELGVTAALVASDRHIEKHIGTAHYTFYQATSDRSDRRAGDDAGCSVDMGHQGRSSARQGNGSAGIGTLVNTFLIYTPMQLLAHGSVRMKETAMEIFGSTTTSTLHFPVDTPCSPSRWRRVVSHEYPQKWVQALAYSASNHRDGHPVHGRDHWSSDMFVGAALDWNRVSYLPCALRSEIKRFVQTPRAVDLLIKKPERISLRTLSSVQPRDSRSRALTSSITKFH